MHKYFTPVGALTGSIQMQPRPDETEAGWYVSSLGDVCDTGFLDATDRIPTGSVRACDCITLTVGVATTVRDDAWRTS